MLRIGLTGGIASGKSHVAAQLQRAGFRRLDLDRVGHDVMAPGGSAYADVLSAFGARILASDGSIDRKALGAIVFADPDARAQLNAIVHPRIRAEEARLVRALEDEQGSVLVVEGALLVEAGQHLRFDRLIVVHCGGAEQQRRLMRRDGIDSAAAALRLRAQMEPDLKRRFAHRVVDSGGSLAGTEHEVSVLASEVRSLAEAPKSTVEAERLAPLVAPTDAAAQLPLGPSRLIEHVESGRSLEDLACALAIPAPWYAPGQDLGQPPEALAGAVAYLGLKQRGDDLAYTAAIAHSIARLLHTAGEQRTHAIAAALALHESATGQAGAPTPQALDMALRWGGSRLPRHTIDAVRGLARAVAR